MAALVLAAWPAAAGATDRCVDVARPGCTTAASPTAALGASVSGDRVLLGEGPYTGPLTVPAGVTLLGLGSRTRISGGTPVLDVAGRAEALAVTGPVRADPGGGATDWASLARATVAGTVTAQGRTALDDVAIAGAAGTAAALVVRCATADARGVTVTGAADHAAAVGCPTPTTATLALRSSVLLGADPVERTGAGAAGGAAPAVVTSAWSAHAEDADVTATDRLDAAGLGADPQPGPGSPLLDAGDPAPLAAPDASTGRPGEPFEDLAGAARMADGNGDGTVRRDVGATEAAPVVPADPAGNVLRNPGAEEGDPMTAGAPVGWSGTFGVAAYGDPDLPSAGTGAALGAGARLFAGSAAAPAELLQRIDLTASGAAIDTGGATASLQGLLGGYGADGDAIAVTAAFRDPEGNPLGSLALGPVPPADRGNDTTLVPRAASGPIPPRTRAVDVTVRGDRVAGGYTDAYADRLALTLSVPGVPAPDSVISTTPINPRLKAFAGVSVLTATPRFDRRGRASVQVACASSTVGLCKGTLELRASLTGGKAPQRIGRYATFGIGPGRVKRVGLHLLVASRTALRKRSRLKARVVAVAADTQGVQRRRVVPLRLSLPAARTAGRRRAASRRSTRGTTAARARRPAAGR